MLTLGVERCAFWCGLYSLEQFVKQLFLPGHAKQGCYTVNFALSCSYENHIITARIYRQSSSALPEIFGNEKPCKISLVDKKFDTTK